MIESRFWREELRADLVWLRRHRIFRRWLERQQVLFERRLIIVAFQIRVLLDRPKVSKSARSAHIDGQLYRKIGNGPVTLMNAVAFDELFDLENPTSVRLSIRDICNQLIHHYVLFALRSGFRRFDTVLVFSDIKKHVGLYELPVEDMLGLFSVFASAASAADYTRFSWDEKRQDYVFTHD